MLTERRPREPTPVLGRQVDSVPCCVAVLAVLSLPCSSTSHSRLVTVKVRLTTVRMGVANLRVD